jgi:hypothetical protein
LEAMIVSFLGVISTGGFYWSFFTNGLLSGFGAC